MTFRPLRAAVAAAVVRKHDLAGRLGARYAFFVGVVLFQATDRWDPQVRALGDRRRAGAGGFGRRRSRAVPQERCSRSMARLARLEP